MNYITKFTREAIYRGFKGEPSYSNGEIKFPASRRFGYMRYLILGGAILTSLGYKRAFLLGVFPTYLSPAAQVTLGMYTYATATSDWQRTLAKKRIYQRWTAFIPGSLAWKDFKKRWDGKKPWNTLFIYEQRKEKNKTGIGGIKPF